jgi:hypothetical protein
MFCSDDVTTKVGRSSSNIDENYQMIQNDSNISMHEFAEIVKIGDVCT